ncbi:MAG: S41 family peptidase [Bacteroidales bacterium]
MKPSLTLTRFYRLLFALWAGAFLSAYQLQAQNNLFELSKSLEIYFAVVKELSLNYAEEINPSELNRTAINSMLRNLDPYTVFIPESQIEQYRLFMLGEYGGIGVNIFLRDQEFCISNVEENSPAFRAGLRKGDYILKINNLDLKERSEEDVESLLSGEVGSQVNLTYRKAGANQVEQITLKREKIRPVNITYSGMPSPGIGLIRLEQFTDKAAKEFSEAFQKLKSEGELEGLIIDIRGNGGGLLDQAVAIANLFVPKGQLIVSTRGRSYDKNRSYFTLNDPVAPQLPLVILVDGRSASASEILAGALQDLDRAVVLGTPTFGKGLVQNILPLPYNNQIKITVAKYYIPSGRCIQAIDYFHKEKESGTESRPTFLTRNGRVVFEGSGIEPDLVPDTTPETRILYDLLENYTFFDYANQYSRQHPEINSLESIVITDALFNDFVNFALQHMERWGEGSLDEVNIMEKNLLKAEILNAESQQTLETLRKNIKSEYLKRINAARNLLATQLAAELANRYFFRTGEVKTFISHDVIVNQAVALIKDKNAYQSVLNGVHPKCHNRKKQ